MLEAIHLSRSVGKKTILEDCSLRLEPGKFTAVVGPNGAGKTTLLKILAGETRQYKGKINLEGKPLSGYKARELSRIRAILSQYTLVSFPFTVEQVIEIGRYAHRSTSVENKTIISEAMELTRTTAFKGRTYQTLSGGEMQRVQMARVIAQLWDGGLSSKYLLLDEPTSSLDLAQQQGLLSLAKTLCSRRFAVMTILHDLNLAAQYADEILFLKNGKIMAYGPVKQVLKQDVIERTFDHPVTLLETGGQMVIVPKATGHKVLATGKNSETRSQEMEAGRRLQPQAPGFQPS